MGYENMIQPIPNDPDLYYYQKRYHCAIPKRAISKYWIDNYYASAALNKIPSPVFATSNAGVWYDPADIKTLFQDSAGTIPVTASGQPVGKMLDKSGKGHHMTQAVADARPIYYRDGQYSWLEFSVRNATNAFMVTEAPIAWTVAGANTALIMGVIQHPQTSAATLLDFSSDSVADTGIFRVLATEDGEIAVESKGTIAATAVSQAVSDYNRAIIMMESRITYDLIDLTVNGTKVTSPEDQGTGTYGTYPLTLGISAGGALPFHGKLFGLVAVNALFTTVQEASLFDYMSIKTPDLSYVSDNLVMKITTPADAAVFTIPCTNYNTFDAIINWGDGTPDVAVVAYNDVNLSHTYADAGDYIVTISGTFPNISFNGAGGATMVRIVENLGLLGWTRFSTAFSGCANLESFVAGRTDTSAVTTILSMFNGCSLLSTIDLSTVVTANVSTMAHMFDGCASVTELDLAHFSTLKVTSYATTFRGCSRLSSLRMPESATPLLTSTDSMFNNCGMLEAVDVSALTTGLVTTFKSMFANCTSLQSVDVAHFDTSAAVNMATMFISCGKLSNVDVSNFDLSGVTDVSIMFKGCSSLTDLDVSAWDTSTVTLMPYLFATCSLLNELDVSNFDTANVTNFTSMFDGCAKLQTLDVSGFTTPVAAGFAYMFKGCSALTSLDLSGFSFASATTTAGMFANDTSLQTVTWPSVMDTPSLTSADDMFANCVSLADAPIDELNVASVDAFNGTSGGFMIGCTFPITRYDATLLAWDAQAVLPSKAVNFGYCQYTAGGAAAAARANLIASDLWVIVDGGLAPDSLPVNTALPVITGSPVVGQLLSCSTGTWSGSPAPTYAYLWRRNGTAIPGPIATPTYTLQAADVGATITCRVTATNTSGLVYASTPGIGPITS